MVVLSSSPSLADTTWPVGRFKVFVGSPYVSNPSTLPVDVNVTDVEQEYILGISQESIRDIEGAFNQAAQWYRSKNFPAPDLTPIIYYDNMPAYQVYVCNRDLLDTSWDELLDLVGVYDNSLARSDFSRCGYNAVSNRTSAGAYSTNCNNSSNRTRIFYINFDEVLDDNGRLTESGYQTIAHELFHAIVSNTPFGRAFRNNNCQINKWITEGLADAISYDIVEELWNGQFQPYTGSKAVMKQYGYRPYVESLYRSAELPIPGEGDSVAASDYGASSFWRFIKNAHSKGWEVLSSSKGLLNNPLVGQGWQSEVKWLDDGLYKIFGIRLQDFYVSFVSYFVYAIPPMTSYRGRPAEDNVPHWSRILFGACKEVDLDSTGVVEVSFDIKPLATQCLWVQTPSISGSVKITFSAQSADIRLFKDIIIGLPGQAGSTRGAPGTPDGGATNYGTWLDFPQDGNKRQLYLVSNLARKPGQTKQRAFNLKVMLPMGTNSDLATVPLPSGRSVPPPEPPAYKKHAKTLAGQRRARSKMAKQQLVEDKKSLTTNTSSAIKVNRRPNTPECREPFRFDACGPQMSITLNVVPGSYLAPGQVSTQGGIAAQVFAGMQTLAETSLHDSSQMAQQLSAKIDAIDGNSVSIAFPMIDYGFSGTISNAAISVKMSGGRTWRAIGPPDASQRTRLTGRVTIEEYTPEVMRGSFIAPLAEFAEAGSSGESTYTRRDTVTGSFTSVAPWRGDGRFAIVNDSVEVMAEDIAATMGVSAETFNSIMEGSAPSSNSTGSSGVGVEVECTCECEMKPFADELCELLCEEEFAVCDSQ